LDNFEPQGLSSFYGGQSVDKKLGTKAQFYYARHIDHRKNPSNFSVLPGLSNAAGGVVTDLLQDMTQINSGVRYSLGDAGNIYTTSTTGIWSPMFSLGEAGGAGIIYRADVDHIYITGQSKVARIQRMTTAGTPQKDWFQRGVSTASTCSKTGGTNSYTVPLVLDESIDKRSFTSDIEPLYQLGVKIINKGIGNWTLTLHDDANNSLGAVLVTNANLTSGQINYFVFSSPIRIQRGNNGSGSALTYHFHLTSTVADGTVATTTVNSLVDCDMELWANALVTTQNTLHPITNFLNFTLIGNGRYVAAYEPLQDNPTTADFDRHRITLPPGYEVCGYAQKNLLCIIGAEKRSTSGEFQEGALFYWDGIGDSYNDWWPVPEGSPEALFSTKNIAYYIAGGSLYRIAGVDGGSKIRTFRNTDSEFSGIADITHVNPNMMAVRRGILLIGYPTSTTNQALEHGVYSLGAISREYPESFGFSYTTSNGTILDTGSNNLRLGMVKSFGDTAYTSWRDDSAIPHTYGVDIVNNSSAPAGDFQIELLNFDNNMAFMYKDAGYAIATFDDLPNGVSLTLKYKIDNDVNWTYSETVTTGKWIVMPIDKRFLTISVGLDGIVNATSPYISSLFLFFDPLPAERPVG
jgi:hypothetical protein